MTLGSPGRSDYDGLLSGGTNTMGEVVTISKPKRPFAVWLAAAINTVLVILVLTASFMSGILSVPAAQLAFWVALALAIWFSTLSAWWGSRQGRNVMLAIITFYLGWVLVAAVQQIGEAREGLGNDAYMLRLVGRFLFSLGCLIANWWLLFNKRARAWFG